MRIANRTLLILSVIAVWGVMMSVRAEESPAPFDVRSAYVEPIERGYMLHVTLDLGLSAAAEDAVRNGVPLTVSVEVQMNRKRKFFIDKKIEDRTISYSVRYDALSDRYIVNSENGYAVAYSQLSEALNALGHVDNIKLLENESIRPSDEVEGSVRATVKVEAGTSTVMRYLMFWIDWRRSTDWYTWRVKQ
jgi:hypothetical protein